MATIWKLNFIQLSVRLNLDAKWDQLRETEDVVDDTFAKNLRISAWRIIEFYERRIDDTEILGIFRPNQKCFFFKFNSFLIILYVSLEDIVFHHRHTYKVMVIDFIPYKL